MTWRRNPSALGALARIPVGARVAIWFAALLAGFLLLGFWMMSGPVAETDRRIEQLERTRAK